MARRILRQVYCIYSIYSLYTIYIETRFAVSLVEYLYENIPLTEMLSCLKEAKKHVHVYCFHRKHFTRRKVNRLYSLLSGQFQLKLFYGAKGLENSASNATLSPCERFRQNHLENVQVVTLTSFILVSRNSRIDQILAVSYLPTCSHVGLGFTVCQPWTDLHDCYFEYLIIRFDYLINSF